MRAVLPKTGFADGYSTVLSVKATSPIPNRCVIGAIGLDGDLFRCLAETTGEVDCPRAVRVGTTGEVDCLQSLGLSSEETVRVGSLNRFSALIDFQIAFSKETISQINFLGGN